MNNFKKISILKTPNIFFIVVSVLLLLGLGIYEAINKYSKRENEVNFIGTSPVPEIPNLKNPEYLDKLLAKEWFWIETVIDSSVGVKPYNFSAFKLKFNSDLTFSSTTDCNNVGGSYEVYENQIKFDEIMQTQMYCMKSRETDYIEGLTNVSEISFNDKNELILKYKDSNTFMRFR